MNPKVSVRQAVINDATALFSLVHELAQFERAIDQIELNLETFTNDGFGKKPFYIAFVAETEKQIVGASICYYRYSTWKGKRLYIEDLIVKESHRNKGIGSMLMEFTLLYAHAEKCNGVVWQVLNWNTPAIEFYKKYNAWFDNEWINSGITKEQLSSFISDKGTSSSIINIEST